MLSAFPSSDYLFPSLSPSLLFLFILFLPSSYLHSSLLSSLSSILISISFYTYSVYSIYSVSHFSWPLFVHSRSFLPSSFLQRHPVYNLSHPTQWTSENASSPSYSVASMSSHNPIRENKDQLLSLFQSILTNPKTICSGTWIYPVNNRMESVTRRGCQMSYKEYSDLALHATG
ncbi:uncharacterized protein BO88DRAFT_173529 [Aspergillus vadensis CBS 113365]|uniref:Uncharacterized protein n=1 Tax=Aspergillus vadensis (strain CBS 113365 / IMI 142717 / IBT 24658) TaxID=1448311 RepID=A0A319CXX7_ASPVC|nr:hypothetical protein BO88DRAFT_173529 [Aspergillus vadensis CBS 113365]PYH72942.1 hypothetical protein BO88DRAFT_173529 [Aspergillus vadensis CBS 113365]